MAFSPAGEFGSGPTKEDAMKFLSWILRVFSLPGDRETLHYHPELHYMRGPGPAYQRLMAKRQERRELPQIVDMSNVR
jgi:hypothetical protein